MNPELAQLQNKLDDILNELYPLLRQYAQIRRISPQVRAESSKVLEQFLLQIMRMTLHKVPCAPSHEVLEQLFRYRWSE